MAGMFMENVVTVNNVLCSTDKQDAHATVYHIIY